MLPTPARPKVASFSVNNLIPLSPEPLFEGEASSPNPSKTLGKAPLGYFLKRI